jgi:hypothetical protein
MQDMLFLSGFVQGLVGGVTTLLVLAVRAALEGRPGVTFADLWVALAVGVAVGAVPSVLARLIARRMRRYGQPYFAGGSSTWGAGVSIDRSHTDWPDERSASGVGDMNGFDKFTDGARKVLTLAQDEAQRFNHDYIGTEHLLLGLARVEEGVAARVLENMNVELAKVRTAVEFIVGRGSQPVVGEVGLTPRGKRVIELAIDESRGLGHNYIGTEHLLLGLVREGEGIAAGVLESLGVNADRVRHEVIRVLNSAEDSG